MLQMDDGSYRCDTFIKNYVELQWQVYAIVLASKLNISTYISSLPNNNYSCLCTFW